MKSLNEKMDLEEWELLPDDGKKMYSPRKDDIHIQMNYFICPPKKSVEKTAHPHHHHRPPPNHVSPVPVDPDPISQVFDMPRLDCAFDEERGGVIAIEEATNTVDRSSEKSKKMELEHGDDGGRVNIWRRRSLAGIGAAICSFGVAAATFCIISFRSHKHPNHNQKVQFQICTDDKRMKQVVHHASKLNEALSAVRGVPLTRAHITFGGYYDKSP